MECPGEIHAPTEEDPLALKGRKLTAAENRARNKALAAKAADSPDQVRCFDRPGRLPWILSPLGACRMRETSRRLG